MKECNVIVFKEDINDPGMANVLEGCIREWFDINKDNISNLHSIFNIELDDQSPSGSRKVLILHYDGDAGIDPCECKHENHFEKLISPGTCDTDSIYGIFCTDCRILLSTYTSDSGISHIGNFVSNNDATCLEDGTMSGICDNCGKQVTEIDVGSALGHNYVWSTHIPESCLTDREEIGICSRCNDTIYRTIENSKLSHNYIWTTEFEETCESDRIEVGTCSMCNDKIRRTILDSKLGHDYVYTSNNDATCLEDGTHTGICSRCGKEVSGVDVGSALGHDYPDEWTIRMRPSCLDAGERFKRCSRCGNEITEDIMPLYHSWVSNNDGTHKCVNGCGVTETCSPNGYGKICEKCGYVTPDFVLKINTNYIDGMVINIPFNQKLYCNALDNTYTWQLISGSLPEGIELFSTGEIDGVPSSSGLYTFTIRCKWKDQHVDKQYSVNIAAELLTVTFNPTGGTVSETTRKVAKGSTIGELPTPTRDGYEFGGWFTAETGGMKVSADYSVASAITLYARWGQGSDLQFGDATSTFNMQYNGDRTNYNNQPYTFYNRYTNGGVSNLTIQTAISSIGNSSNMTTANPVVKLYMKVTNNGDAGTFDIGFDCDSYVAGNDCLYITRLENGVNLNNHFTVTVPYDTSIWMGKYNSRVSNRYNNVSIGTKVGNPNSSPGSSDDTGYAFTMNNIFINSGSYTILEVTFTKLS